MPERTTDQRIREDYPHLAFLINDPEIGPLLLEAVDPNKGFSPQAFQAKLINTDWYKKRSQTWRQMQVLENTDPAEYKRRLESSVEQMKMMSQRMGYNISTAELLYWGKAHMDRGIQVGSPESMHWVARWLREEPRSRSGGPGGVQAAQDRIKSMASAYFIPPGSKKELHEMGVNLAMGLIDENTVRQTLQRSAISRFPHLKRELESGRTMDDIFSGHRAVIAEQLELAPDTVNFTKGQWAKVLGTSDPKTGQVRPMTLHETQTLARQDSRWWNTSGGREMDAGMSNFILQAFGARA